MGEEHQKRIAVLNRDLCNPEKCGYICEHYCPMNRMGKKCITHEEGSLITIAEELCSGCGICVKKCPFKAIKIVNLVEARGDLVHQYGKNAFRLYGLPLPKQGVCGFVGKNGIGKTTAMKILSGLLKPNFGMFDKPPSDVPSTFPIQTRLFLNSLNKKTLSHKPQNIETLRKFKKTVRDLMTEMIGENTEKAVKMFNLQYLLERQLSHLSGGELQKVAIAVAYWKNAEIYFFDEITNYLDISERLLAAFKIRDLADKKEVVVTDHDLAILDYLSDYIYIFYGEENAFGCVSGAKHVRNGINEYLDGYLSEENVKFRERSIMFNTYQEKEVVKDVLFTYASKTISYPSFTLEAAEGNIRRGEVVGIVGRNALGKTTFVKYLAGAEKAGDDAFLENEEKDGIRISYKPQYIEVKEEHDCVVEQLFRSKGIASDIAQRCIHKLKIGHLAKRKLTQLSGGELQRVAITLALSREADLYVLDEPTAFLDVEQRLFLAELLHQLFAASDKAAFVVDHDIVFLNAVSSRLIMFEGQPGKHATCTSPLEKYEGMTKFLKSVNITIRLDRKNGRPRINKRGSVKDEEQRRKGEWYGR